MRKLNKKGFTLVELLAVIIILAVVVGITIPAVLTTVDDARKKAGADAAAIMADWVDKQYGLVSIGFGGEDSAFTGICGNTGTSCVGDTGYSFTGNATNKTKEEAFIVSAGLKVADIDVSSLKVKINSATGRSCVTFNAKQGGSYYVNRDSSQQRQGGTC